MDQLIILFENMIIRPYIEWKLGKALERQYSDLYRHFTEYGWPLDFSVICSDMSRDILGFDVGWRLMLGSRQRFPGLNLELNGKGGGFINGSIGVQHVYYRERSNDILIGSKELDKDANLEYLGEL